MDFVFSKPAKMGPVPRRVMAGTGPEGYRYAAASRTGIPILRALSTRLLVSPANVDRRCQGLSEHDIIGTFQCVME